MAYNILTYIHMHTHMFVFTCTDKERIEKALNKLRQQRRVCPSIIINYVKFL